MITTNYRWSTRVENGYLKLNTGPGWGTEVNEEVVRAHPAK